MTAVLPRFEPPASRRSSERSGDNGGGEPVRSAPAGTRWTGDVPSRDETDAVPLLTDCSRGVVAVEETTGVDDPHPMRATDWGRDATTSVNSSLQKPKGPKCGGRYSDEVRKVQKGSRSNQIEVRPSVCGLRR